MANKYDVRQQIESEKSNRQQQLISNTVSFINSGLSLAGDIYDEVEQNKKIAEQQQEELDYEAGKQCFVDNIYTKQYEIDNELSYDKVITKEATVVNPEPILSAQKGNTGFNTTAVDDREPTILDDEEYTYVAKSASAKYQSQYDFFSNYVANHPELFEGASDAFMKGFNDSFDEFWKDKRLSMSEELITSNDKTLKDKADSNSDLAIKNAGTNADYYEKQLGLKLGGDLSKAHYEITEVPDVSDENYSVKKMEHDYDVIKNYIYEERISYRGYTPEDAEQYVEENSVAIAMYMELNSAQETIDKEIKSDSNFNYALWAMAKAEGFLSSPLVTDLGLTNKVSQEQLDTFKSELMSKAQERVAIFQQEIQTGSSKLFDTFLNGITNTENPLTVNGVYNAVDSLCEELGTTREVLVANMDSDTYQTYTQYLNIAQTATAKANAVEIAKVINDDALVVQWAVEHGVEFDTENGNIELLRLEVKNMQDVYTQQYLYDDPYTTEHTVVAGQYSSTSTSGTTSNSSIGTAKTKNTTGTTVSSSSIIPSVSDRIDEADSGTGIKDLNTVVSSDEYDYHSGQWKEKEKALKSSLLMLDAVDKIDTYITNGETDFVNLLREALTYEEDKAENRDAEEIPDTENETMLAIREILTPLSKTAQQLGITDITQLNSDQVQILKDYLNAQIENLSNSMVEDSNYFSTIDVAYQAKSAKLIKNDAVMAITGDKFKNSYLGNVKTSYETAKAEREQAQKEYDISVQDNIITNGQNELISTYATINTLTVLLEAVNEGMYSSTEVQSLLYTVLEENPELYKIAKQAIELAGDVDTTSAKGLQSAINSLTASADNIASEMAGASSKKSTLDSTYTARDKTYYTNEAKKNKAVETISSTLGNTEDAIKSAIDEKLQALRTDKQDAINMYEWTGQKSQTFLNIQSLLSEKDSEGNITEYATDAETLTYLKNQEKNLTSEFGELADDGYLDGRLAVYKEYFQNSVQNKYKSHYNIQYDTIDLTNITDVTAIDELYEEAGLSGAENTSDKYAELLDYYYNGKTEGKPETMVEKYLPTSKGEETEESKIEAIQYNTENQNVSAYVFSLFNKKKSEIDSKNVQDLSQMEEASRRLDNKETYKEAVQLAEDSIEDDKTKAEALAKQLNESIQESVWGLLSMNTSEDSIKAQLCADYGISAKEAEGIIANCNALSYSETDGIYTANTEAFNFMYHGADISGIVNNMIKSHCSGLTGASLASESREYGGRLVYTLYKASQAGETDLEKVLQDFQIEEKKRTDEVLSKVFNSDSYYVESTRTKRVDSTKVGAQIGDLGYGKMYNDGELYFTSYNARIQDAKDSDNSQTILNILSNDTSISKTDKKRYSLGLAINTLLGTQVVSLEDLNKMSLQEITDEAVKYCDNSYQFQELKTLAEIYYSGSDGLQKLLKYSTDCWWLDSSFSNAEIRYTDTGHIYTCQDINGNMLYAEPIYGDNGIDTFVFYEDENLTKVVFNPMGKAIESVSDTTVEQLNVSNIISSFNYDKTGLLNKDITINEDDSDFVKEYKQKLADKEVTWIDSDFNVYFGTLKEAKEGGAVNIIVGQKINAVSANPWESKKVSVLSSSSREALSQNSIQNTQGSVPNYLYSVDISGSTNKISKSEPYSWSSINFNKTDNSFTDKSGNVYTIDSNGKITPKISTGNTEVDKSKTVSKENMNSWYNEAKIIAVRSGGQVTAEEAYLALSEAKQGYDKAFTILGTNNQVYTYIPKIYDYIVAGWYL